MKGRSLLATAGSLAWIAAAVTAAATAAEGDRTGAAERTGAGVQTRGPSPRWSAALDHDALARIPLGGAVQLEDLPLGDERRIDLVLERFEVFAPGGRFVVADGGRQGERPRPRLVLLRGGVAGDADSLALVGVSPHGVHGFVDGAAGLHLISTGPFDAAAGLRGAREVYVTAAADLPALAGPGASCHAVFDEAVLAAFRAAQEGRPPRAGEPAPCRTIELAVETDWEFTSRLFGGDTEASAAYAMTLLGAVNEIYRRDLRTAFEVGFLRVWSSSADPWNGGSTGAQLEQFREYWIENEEDVERDLAHFLSGRNLGGGVAYLGGICSGTLGYAVSANLDGSFPMPLQHNHSGNWDVYVTAHELGHNVGTPHTHDYGPPIDGCAFGDCQDADQGTIMSYCHQCPGGVANIRLEFHPIVLEAILAYLDGVPCRITPVEDVNRDGSVDFVDVIKILTNWGVTGDVPSDVNGDGVVDFEDLLQVIAAWNPCS